MSKTIETLLAEFHETKTSTIADIPASLALEAHEQWKTIRHTQLIERLTQFHIDIETQTGAGIMNIETNLGLALADIAEALDVKEPEDLLKILGSEAYLAIYWDPIPYRPAPPPLHRVRLLLAQLRDTWRGKWGDKPKVETEPC